MPSDFKDPQVQCRQLCRQMTSGSSQVQILDKLDLEVAKAESLVILGPSGSGKSTLLGLIAGLDRPNSGSITFEGQELEGQSEDSLAKMRRGRIGFVFQDFQLLGNLTASENISLPMELTGLKDAKERTKHLLAEVGLSDRGHHYPSQLSGGEQQRVALARAFGTSPSLVLADEPTGNLDPKTGNLVLDFMFKLRESEGITLIVVTHDLAVAERAQRVLHLEDGRLVEGSETKS